MISFTTFISSLLIILLLQHVLAQSEGDFDPDLICSLIANGTKIKDPANCYTFMQCIDQKPLSGSCASGLFYDRDTEECVNPKNTTCLSSNPCAATPVGFVSDPYSCNGYYYCSNGEGIRGACSSGMNFNPDTNNCMRDYPCEITMYPDDYCNLIPQGVFIKNPNSCNEYQMCWNSKLINGTCPNGFYFNAFAGDCDYPQNVHCEDVSTPIPEIPADVKCTTADSFISDGYTCNGYFYCQLTESGDFHMIHGDCPVGRFFDATEGGSCVNRTQIECPYNRCVTMGLNYIQLANVVNDGCVGFSICQRGQVIDKGQCPEGQYFDEMTQLCTTNVVTYPACAMAAGRGDTTDVTTAVDDQTTEATTVKEDEVTGESTTEATTVKDAEVTTSTGATQPTEVTTRVTN